MQLVKQYIFKKTLNASLIGSTAVEIEHAAAREEICRGCKHFGTVEPTPGLTFPGCTLCGCPVKTKVVFDTIPRVPENVGDPLTVAEILQQLKNNLLQKSDLVPQKITCSDKTNNRWAEVDNKFFKL